VGGKVGIGILVAIVAAVLVVALVPSLRHSVNNLKNSILGRYQNVPVATATATGFGSCTAPLISGNNTVYWYTRAFSSAAPQMLTVTLPTSFTGDVNKIAFTPLVPSTGAPQAGQASPNPMQLVLTATPAGAAVAQPVNLQDPPKFQSVSVSVSKPATLQLQLAATDPGAAPGTCAETGIVFYEKG